MPITFKATATKITGTSRQTLQNTPDKRTGRPKKTYYQIQKYVHMYVCALHFGICVNDESFYIVKRQRNESLHKPKVIIVKEI